MKFRSRKQGSCSSQHISKGLGFCLSSASRSTECLLSSFLINHLGFLLFVSGVSTVWPDQNLENGSSGGPHCVLPTGGITEPSSVPRGASGPQKDIQGGILSCGEWVLLGQRHPLMLPQWKYCQREE